MHDQAQHGDQPDHATGGPPGAHRVTLTERGPFLAPECSCGWYGAARRSRPLARAEAAAHLAGAGTADAAGAADTV